MARAVGLTVAFPKVTPGRYTTAVWCIPCGPPRGTWFASVWRGSGSRADYLTVTR